MDCGVPLPQRLSSGQYHPRIQRRSIRGGLAPGIRDPEQYQQLSGIYGNLPGALRSRLCVLGINQAAGSH